MATEVTNNMSAFLGQAALLTLKPFNIGTIKQAPIVFFLPIRRFKPLAPRQGILLLNSTLDVHLTAAKPAPGVLIYSKPSKVFQASEYFEVVASDTGGGDLKKKNAILFYATVHSKIHQHPLQSTREAPGDRPARRGVVRLSGDDIADGGL
ncbi:hypothetical protein DFH09DRAFT_1098363 [Mycena vulgaris]|nr:hypothetical protein DFH09DRAFT_1098363 [Mycena vulgaris]